MGKRLTIIHHTKIADHAVGLAGKVASVVLKSGQTWQVTIASVSADCLTTRDALHKQHRIAVSDIEEIILDKETDF